MCQAGINPPNPMSEPHFRIQQFEDAIPTAKELHRAVSVMERKLASKHTDSCVNLDAEKFERRWAQAQANRTR